jgi:hypothetical protein
MGAVRIPYHQPFLVLVQYEYGAGCACLQSHHTAHTAISLSPLLSLPSPLLSRTVQAQAQAQAGRQSVSLSSFPFLLSPDDSLTPTPPVWHEGALEVKAAVYCSSSAQRCFDRNHHEIACFTCVYAARGTSLSTLTALS